MIQDSFIVDVHMRAEREGWFVTGPILDHSTIAAFIAELQPMADSKRGRGGLRNLLDESPAVTALARSTRVRSIAEAILGPGAFVVRALLFDKTPDANWRVVWHQDLTIAVAERHGVAGYGPWSRKEGVHHVQPPTSVLEQMLAVRIHLDDCGPGNGPVRVISGTHREGRLSPLAMEQLRATHPESVCVVRKGAVLAFHPLLLHASSPSLSPTHRRVIHFEFASATLARLPGGLAWRWVV